MDKQKLIGALFVLLGAISYGILATLVKYANNLGIPISALTFFQYAIGFVILLIINSFSRPLQIVSPLSKLKLSVWGISLGLTTTLYYLSIQYIPVSVGIILLMQSIWMSFVLEAALNRVMPTLKKSLGAMLCILGTLLASKIFNTQFQLDWSGILLGIGAGTAYTISIYASSSVEKQHSNYVRSLYLVTGGLILVTLFWNFKIIEHVSIPSFYWGTALALFGTIIPPLLFTFGVPKIGMGTGSVISSVEIPVSILSACILLQENVSLIQSIGVFLILLSVLIVNLNWSSKSA